jgi:hypothetical protein
VTGRSSSCVSMTSGAPTHHSSLVMTMEGRGHRGAVGARRVSPLPTSPTTSRGPYSCRRHTRLRGPEAGRQASARVRAVAVASGRPCRWVATSGFECLGVQ